jgi:hypothetical protein
MEIFAHIWAISVILVGIDMALHLNELHTKTIQIFDEQGFNLPDKAVDVLLGLMAVILILMPVYNTYYALRNIFSYFKITVNFKLYMLQIKCVIAKLKLIVANLKVYLLERKLNQHK